MRMENVEHLFCARSNMVGYFGWRWKFKCDFINNALKPLRIQETKLKLLLHFIQKQRKEQFAILLQWQQQHQQRSNFSYCSKAVESEEKKLPGRTENERGWRIESFTLCWAATQRYEMWQNATVSFFSVFYNSFNFS